MESLRLSPHKNYLAPIKQKSITGGGDPRSMVPVRLAGAGSWVGDFLPTIDPEMVLSPRPGRIGGLTQTNPYRTAPEEAA